MPFIKKYAGLVIGIAAWGLNYLFWHFPALADVLYYRGFFQLLRYVYDYTLGLLPIPMVYVFFIALVVLIGRYLRRVQRAWRENEGWVKPLASVGELASLVGLMLAMFFVFWGYNYSRYTIYEEQGMVQRPEIPQAALLAEAEAVTLDLNALRKRLSADTSRVLGVEALPSDMERSIRKHLSAVLSDMGYPVGGRPRVRHLRPSGLLLRISTAGVYIPYAFEGHIDAGLHPIQQPYTMAHEMTHAYGFTDEGVCNFIGYLACMASEEDVFHYSAQRVYWRYLMRAVKKADRSTYDRLRRTLDEGVWKDLEAIQTQMDRYPDVMPAVRDKVYDSYLKANGVRSGLQSYGEMVEMIYAWKNRSQPK